MLEIRQKVGVCKKRSEHVSPAAEVLRPRDLRFMEPLLLKSGTLQGRIEIAQDPLRPLIKNAANETPLGLAHIMTARFLHHQSRPATGRRRPPLEWSLAVDQILDDPSRLLSDGLFIVCVTLELGQAESSCCPIICEVSSHKSSIEILSPESTHPSRRSGTNKADRLQSIHMRLPTSAIATTTGTGENRRK